MQKAKRTEVSSPRRSKSPTLPLDVQPMQTSNTFYSPRDSKQKISEVLSHASPRTTIAINNDNSFARRFAGVRLLCLQQ